MTNESELLLPPAKGCWVASYYDGSGYAIFPTEVEALRYALEHTMNTVKFVEWGEV